MFFKKKEKKLNKNAKITDFITVNKENGYLDLMPAYDKNIPLYTYKFTGDRIYYKELVSVSDYIIKFTTNEIYFISQSSFTLDNIGNLSRIDNIIDYKINEMKKCLENKEGGYLIHTTVEHSIYLDINKELCIKDVIFDGSVLYNGKIGYKSLSNIFNEYTNITGHFYLLETFNEYEEFIESKWDIKDFCKAKVLKLLMHLHCSYEDSIELMELIGTDYDRYKTLLKHTIHYPYHISDDRHIVRILISKFKEEGEK